MRYFNHDWTKEGVARWLKVESAKWVWNGRDTPHGTAYIDHCTAAHVPTGSILILTREDGYHTSGWWKNPDYERCLHLSVSFRDPETGEKLPRDKSVTEDWLTLIFGDYRRLIWSEPPCSDEGKKGDMWHYRLFFADPAFTAPILPRGEVYSKEFTEAGWLSFSDMQAKLEKEAADAQA